MINLLSSDAFPVLKSHAAFDAGAPSFEELMLKGESKDTWIDLCEKVGQFLATMRKNFDAKDVAAVVSDESIRKQSVLGEWIENVNSSWDDSIKSIVPASRLSFVDSSKMKARGQQAAELMEHGKFLNAGNLVTKNVQLLSSQRAVQINFDATELVLGPLGLDVATFLADVLVAYHQQLRLEHTLRYVTSDCAKLLGRAFDKEMNSSESDSKKFWAQTSLLTGWEIIRRATEDQTLLERSQRNEVDLVDVFEAGLRLVYNANIDNVGFMVTVALAEI